jgi:hypothetical protein
MPITIQLFTATSGVAAHPSVDLTVPPGYKVLGGGAFDNYNSGYGNMLTASYPSDARTWSVAGKDHETSDPAAISAYALALYDPNNEWDVVISSEISNPEAHPTVTAILPAGYTLTGGGAQVHWHGAGNLLTAMFPSSANTWEARSKDHDVSDPSQITAYAIGIKSRNGGSVKGTIQKAQSGAVPHPTVQATLPNGWMLSGGGAFDDWTGDGNLLTASYPSGSSWVASGKDHKVPDPASITAYVIGITA